MSLEFHQTLGETKCFGHQKITCFTLFYALLIIHYYINNKILRKYK